MGKELVVSMKILLLLTLLIFSSVRVFSSGTDVVPSPTETENPNGNPTKEEEGILGILVAGYSQIRTIVRYTYDEVIYFRELVSQAKRVKEWWENSKEIVGNIRDEGVRLKDADVPWYDKVFSLRNIVDNIDELTIGQVYEFDRIAASCENSFDRMVQDTFSFRGQTFNWTPGALVPNTNEIVQFFELKVLNDSSSINGSMKLPPRSDVTYTDVKVSIDTSFLETKVRDALKYIAASAMARSHMYSTWEARTSQNKEQLDEQLELFSGANKTEMVSSWYSLERVNALGKLVDHSAQELKALQGLLGYEMYQVSIGVNNRMQAFEQAKSLQDAYLLAK